jgi:hypothetical protein
MPPTSHNDLHPTAHDHTQQEGCEEGHGDFARQTLLLSSSNTGLAISASSEGIKGCMFTPNLDDRGTLGQGLRLLGALGDCVLANRTRHPNRQEAARSSQAR